MHELFLDDLSQYLLNLAKCLAPSIFYVLRRMCVCFEMNKRKMKKLKVGK